VKYAVPREAPESRRGKHDRTHEEHFPEAAVMLAFAMHLFDRGAREVEIHPDGMHARMHDISAWLTSAGTRTLARPHGYLWQIPCRSGSCSLEAAIALQLSALRAPAMTSCGSAA